MAKRPDVVDRADLLMRRRSFVAVPASQRPATAPPAAPVEDDDLPVLTEVVSAEAAVSEDRSDRFDETRAALLASEITHAIGQQLSVDLPALLETVLQNASDELRSGIAATVETALRDFIARRKQLSLPLDEPNRDER